MDFFVAHPHWFWFLACMLFFPRISMLCFGVCSGGWSHIVLFWFGWVLTPRLVVAILATTFYWNTNPVLCVLAWLYALTVGSATTKGGGDYVCRKR